MEFIDKEKYSNLFGIYKIEHMENGKTYIGQTRVRFVERYWLHAWKLNNGSHENKYLQRAWDKYGEEAFSFSVVEVLKDESLLDEKEMFYISAARECGSGCFNLTDGGGGKKGTPMSERARKIVGSKNREHNIGKKHSAETKAKMSASKMGIPRHCVRKNINEETILRVKTLIMSGMNSVTVAKICEISYGVVNGILCRHTWADIVVDGWEEFLASRKTYTRTPKKKE